MSTFSVDLAKLPFPAAIEDLSYESILTEMKADLLARWPFTDVESEPLVFLLEVAAYYRLIDRQRVNDAARASFIPLATGSDLDNLAAFYGVMRLVVTPGDPAADPPVADVMETDEAFRRRILLALEAQSTAGPRGAYAFHALSAHQDVVDVAVYGPDDTVPAPLGPVLSGNVLIVVLRSPSAALDAEVHAAVDAAVSAEDVRPLCDTVTVAGALAEAFDLTASLTTYPGVDTVQIQATAEAAALSYIADHYKIGHDISRSGLFAALHQAGVRTVTLTEPAADVIVDGIHYPEVGAVSVTAVAGTDV